MKVVQCGVDKKDECPVTTVIILGGWNKQKLGVSTTTSAIKTSLRYNNGEGQLLVHAKENFLLDKSIFLQKSLRLLNSSPALSTTAAASFWSHSGYVNLQAPRLSCAIFLTQVLQLLHREETKMEDPIVDVEASAKKGGLSQTEKWIKEQDVLKDMLVVFDDFPWRLGGVSFKEGKALGGGVDGSKLRLQCC